MKKKILGILLLTFVFFGGIFNVNALTKNEFNIIENDVLQMVYFWNGISYFEEGELPDNFDIKHYACYQFNDYESEYFVGWLEPEHNYGPKYKIPAEVFEKLISDSFDTSEAFFVNFRENFKPEGFITEAEYMVEDKIGYYTYGIQDGFGVATDFFYDFRGYQDLGNSNYQLYYYLAFNENDMEQGYELPENAVEGIDYVIREDYYGEPTKYIIIEESTSKVYFNGQKTKMLSYLPVDREDIPSNEELILPEDVNHGAEDVNLFLEGANQKFDASKDKKLIFRINIDFSLFDKVYINGKEVDAKYYAVTEGSTVITFSDEYTKTLKNGNYDLKVTFKDGTSAETTFSVANSVANASTGLYTGVGIAAAVALLACSLVFVRTRKHSRFPQM